MKTPTPVEIATVAAPIYAAMPHARASMTDAVNEARKLIKEAEKSAVLVPPILLLNSEKAAKQIGYVSRNWRNQLRKFCARQWPQIAARLPSLWRDANGEIFFAFYDAQGWNPYTIEHLKAAKQAALTESRKRPKPVKGKSRGN